MHRRRIDCRTSFFATTSNPISNKTREVAHDGSVTFYAYNTKGQETERATFPLAYQSALTRPALRFATSVTSTKWHATWNLPTQIAAPGQITSSSYSASGNLTGQSSVATTDATGAAKFGAVKTGPINATGYAYNAGGLNTAIVQRVNNVESQRWTLAYNALGDLTKITDVTGGNVSATMTQHTADGRLLRGTTDLGVPIAIGYSPRGSITQISRGGVSTSFTYNPAGTLIQTRAPNNQVIDYVVDATQAIVDVKLNGASITPQMLAKADYPDTTLKALLANTQEWLAQGVQGLMRPAQAQGLGRLIPRPPPAPVFDPRNDMLMRPIGGPDNASRVISEMIARACRCDPNQGFSAPKFTAVTFAHVFGSGHILPMFTTKSTFAATEKVGQALVDEVISRASIIRPNGTRTIILGQYE